MGDAGWTYDWTDNCVGFAVWSYWKWASKIARSYRKRWLP